MLRNTINSKSTPVKHFSHLPLFTFNITYLLDWNNRLIRHNDGMLVFVYLFYNTRARNIGAACFFCIGNKISYRYFLFYTDIISDYIDFFIQLSNHFLAQFQSFIC